MAFLRRRRTQPDSFSINLFLLFLSKQAHVDAVRSLCLLITQRIHSPLSLNYGLIYRVMRAQPSPFKIQLNLECVEAAPPLFVTEQADPIR